MGTATKFATRTRTTVQKRRSGARISCKVYRIPTDAMLAIAKISMEKFEIRVRNSAMANPRGVTVAHGWFCVRRQRSVEAANAPEAQVARCRVDGFTLAS